MKLSISGKIAAAVAAFVFVSAEAEEYKLGNISDWQKSGGFVQHAPNILHGKGRIVAFSAKTFPYDPQKTYTFKGLYRQKPGSDSNIFRIGIVPLDENGKIMEYAYTNPVLKTDTVLKKAVSPEDKTILIENAATWNTRCFVALNTQPDLKDLPNLNLIRQKPVKITKTAEGWKIDFSQAVGVSFPAGTRLRQHYHGSQYRYAGVGTGGEVLGNFKCKLWPKGTKSFRVIILSGTDGIKQNENIPVLEVINPAIEAK